MKKTANKFLNKYITSISENSLDSDITIFYNAKKCALISIDEIIKTGALIDEDTYIETPLYEEYWKQIRAEIKKIKFIRKSL